MKASQTYQCIVKFDGAGFWTNTIKKQRATCTWSDKVAASRLDERLFGEDNAYITRMPAQAGRPRKARREPLGAVLWQSQGGSVRWLTSLPTDRSSTSRKAS